MHPSVTTDLRGAARGTAPPLDAHAGPQPDPEEDGGEEEGRDATAGLIELVGADDPDLAAELVREELGEMEELLGLVAEDPVERADELGREVLADVDRGSWMFIAVVTAVTSTSGDFRFEGKHGLLSSPSN